MKIDVLDIRARVAAIEAVCGVPAAAHELELLLHRDTLQAIANGCAEPGALAAEALRSLEIEFPRITCSLAPVSVAPEDMAAAAAAASPDFDYAVQAAGELQDIENPQEGAVAYVAHGGRTFLFRDGAWGRRPM